MVEVHQSSLLIVTLVFMFYVVKFVIVLVKNKNKNLTIDYYFKLYCLRFGSLRNCKTHLGVGLTWVNKELLTCLV